MSPFLAFEGDTKPMHAAQLCWGHQVPHFLTKIPGIPRHSGSEQEKDTVRFEQWLHSISDTRRNFSKQLVRAAINKLCVGYAANAICCLPPGMTLDE